MPKGPTLYLLGAQRETLDAAPGAIIESDAGYYKRRAQAAQAAWFDHPDLEHQREYGHLLKRWAKATKNRSALAFANELLEIAG